MIINIPIEPIPMRYSTEWDTYFEEFFKKYDIPYQSVYGRSLSTGIEEGRFLDVYGTQYYKSSQLMNLVAMLRNGSINNGDVLFFHDLWFPGIEQIAYVRDAMGLDIGITGCLHAGAYDHNDFLYQKKMGKWAVHFEHALFAIADVIFLATEFHKNLLQSARYVDNYKLRVTGFPIYCDFKPSANRKDIVVFPHRLDEEKQPELFDTIQKSDTTGFDWVKTVLFNDKEKYFKTLEIAKIAVSFAKQETWGIAMQEAVLRGCIPVVPDRLSYTEMYLEEFRYSTDFEAKDMISHWINSDYPIDLMEKQREQLDLKGYHAIGKIMRSIT